MADFAEDLVIDVFSSAFVDESRFIERLGGSKADIDIIRRYLSLPVAARPELSVFFDREFYWQCYPDVRAADIDPLVHFMTRGVSEKRTPHPLISIPHILTAAPGALPDPITIDALHDLLCRDLIDTSLLFSLDFYRRQLDGSEIPDGGLLRHFLETGVLRGLRPNPAFDPLPYYRQMEGKTFDIRSGLRHFALSEEAFQAVTTEPATEDQAKAMFLAKADATHLFYQRNPLRFECSEKPDLSVIVVLRDKFALTLQTLASLRLNYSGPIELILIDSGSSDETRQLPEYVCGACLLRFDSDVGFVRGCNAGLAVATTDTVLYLNNGIELAVGAVAAALRRLRSDVTIGAVGAKVIRTHGLLQEAGCIIWQDGWTAGYQRDQSPLSPEANFVRDVDFCSAVFLLARGSVLRELSGLDVNFAAAGFEDTDLCVRIRQAGYRVVYDPAAVVYHLDPGMPKEPAAANEAVREAHRVFLAKHQDHLGLSGASDLRAQLFARLANHPPGQILLIEDCLPLRRLGSGFVRSSDIVGIMAGLGYQVTVYPMRRDDQDLASVYADFPDTVEVMHDRSVADLEQFLYLRRGYYDTIWIVRSHNLDRVRPILEKVLLDVPGTLRVVLDTEAIGAIREAQRHVLLGSLEPFDIAQAIRAELRNASFCDNVLAVTSHDAETMQALGLSNVEVLGHLRPVALTPRSWTERAGLLFVGAMHENDSPNYDSLCWFVDEVLPLIAQQLGYETRLTIAGFAAAGVDVDRFRDHPRITLRGVIADLTPLYNSHRVFVAPTRYAAGLPYKIHEAASLGVPVVATEVLRRQLGWDDGRDLLAADAADPAAFARQVLALYRSEALWNRVRTGAAERIRVDCGQEAFERVVARVLRRPVT